MNHNPLKIAFLAYTWRADRKLDPYLNEILNGFLRMGAEVHLFLGNRFADRNFVCGIHPDISLQKLNEFFKNQSFDLCISFNFSLLPRSVQESLQCPILCWLVDDFDHLFYPDSEPGSFDAYTSKVQVIVSACEFQNIIRSHAPSCRTHLIPTATRVDPILRQQQSREKAYEISWVGSFLDCRHLITLIKRAAYNPTYIDGFRKCFRAVQLNHRADLVPILQEARLYEPLRDYKDYTFTATELRAHILNVLSNIERSAAILRLTPLGFSLFGNLGWIETLPQSLAFWESLKLETPVKDHAGLMKVYNQSRICVNVPQIQSGHALPYRVMDILASDALLITQYHPESDAFHFFGPDCPIVMYKDLDDLERLCKYYLSHEEERRAVVQRCNQLVQKGFDFDERCQELLSIAGIPLPLDSNTQLSRGVVVPHSPSSFWTVKARIRRSVNAGIAGVLKWVIERLSPSFRGRLERLFRELFSI